MLDYVTNINQLPQDWLVKATLMPGSEGWVSTIAACLHRLSLATDVDTLELPADILSALAVGRSHPEWVCHELMVVMFNSLPMQLRDNIERIVLRSPECHGSLVSQSVDDPYNLLAMAGFAFDDLPLLEVAAPRNMPADVYTDWVVKGSILYQSWRCLAHLVEGDVVWEMALDRIPMFFGYVPNELSIAIARRALQRETSSEFAIQAARAAASAHNIRSLGTVIYLLRPGSADLFQLLATPDIFCNQQDAVAMAFLASMTCLTTTDSELLRALLDPDDMFLSLIVD